MFVIMRLLLAFCRKTMLGLLVALLIASSFCHGGSVEFTGAGECADCLLKNIQATKAFNGLLVTINCKLASGEKQIIGTAELDKQGKFKISLPEEIVKEDGELKEDCYAQLHDATNAPCPAHDGMESSKIVSVSKSDDGKNTLSTAAGKIKFSFETCVSPSLWSSFKYPPSLPTLPPIPTFKKPLPFPKPSLPPPVPAIPKPRPPIVPVVIPKPLLPPVPVVPIPKPSPKLPPPLPYTKPLPPFKYPKPLPPFPPVTLPPISKPKFPGHP